MSQFRGNGKRGERSERLASFRRFLLGALSLSLLSCSPSAKIDAAGQEEKESETCLTNSVGAKRLAESLTNSLASGMFLKADELTLKADEKNTFSFNEANLSFSLDSLSFHGINLGLEAEVDYNGSGGRSLDARIVDDELYFALEAPGAEGADYSVSYKVSLASYLFGEEERDSTTGGLIHYEYGRLDWILEDILQILSSYGYETKPSFESTDLSLHFSEISQSLDELKEIDAENHYFLWNLPIGDNTYSIGLKGDEEYSVSGIDFPAKGTSASNEIANGMELNCSFSLVSSGARVQEPENSSSYLSLDNSIGLWERLADFAGKLSFNVSTSHMEEGAEKDGLVLTHHEDEVESTATTLGRVGFDEKVLLALSGGADFKNRKINNVSADLTLAGEKQTKKISLNYLQEESDKRAYVNVNDILKVKTSKTTADAFISAFSSLLSDESIANEYLTSLINSMNSIGEAFENLRKSLVGKDIEEGHYEHLLEALTNLESTDNEILATFDFSKAGGSGKVTFLLSGNSLSLAEIRFDGLSLGGFGVDGTLKILDYEGAGELSEDGFEEMDHLPTLTDQIKNLSQHYSAKGKVLGYVLDRGTTCCTQDARFSSLNGKNLTEEGFTIDGDFAFNLQEKAAYGNAVILDRKADYLNEHALSIQLDGEIGAKESDGDMLFSYDSSNDLKDAGAENYGNLDYGKISEPTNKTLYGKFNVASLNDILSLATTLLSSDDPRFTRFTSAADTIATTLVAKIAQGQFAPLLTEKILVSVNKSGDKISAVVSKSLFGAEEDIPIGLSFDENGLSSIDFSLTTEKKEIYMKLDFEVPETTLTKENLKVSDLEGNRSSATDFSSLSTLLRYVLGSATLGEDESNTSTYHLSGTATLTIAKYFDNDVPFDVFISLDGAEIKVIGTLSVPMIALANGGGTKGGTRYVEFYYHTSGNDSDGTIFFHGANEKKGGVFTTKITASEDWAKVKASDFASNIMNWMMKYVMGMNSTVMSLIEKNTSSSETGSSLHGEDIISSYAYEENGGAPIWNAKMDLSSLSSALSSPLEIKIEGKEVNAGGAKQKTLTALSGSIGMLLNSIITIKFSLSLVNVSTGTYVPVWNRNSSSSDDQIKFHSCASSSSVSEKTVHAADAYAENYYGENGYLTSGNFASAKLYVTYE